MTRKKSVDKRFISIVHDIYRNLDLEQRETLKYSVLIELAMKRLQKKILLNRT